MKKIYTLCLAILGLSALSLNAQDTYSVTFNVNTETIDVDPAGIFLAGGMDFGVPGDNPLTDMDDDGVWTITVEVAANYTGYYTFTNGACADWGCKENIAGQDCANPDNFNDRQLSMVNSDMTINTCFGECSTDGSCSPLPDGTMVTFQVDMSEVTETFTTPEVNGQFESWSGGTYPLTDTGNGVWEATIELAPGTYEYKFAADSWGIQETLASGSSCTITTGEFTNRIITVEEGTPMTLPLVCYGSCEACGGGSDMSNVTFKVDMTNVTDAFTTPEVNGEFEGWNGGTYPLTDAGNGVWETTISLAVGDTLEYKFAADSWSIQEELEEGSSCTLTTDGFTNRVVIVEAGNMDLGVVCWESCDDCDGGGSELATVTFKVDMTEVTDAFTTPEVNGEFEGWSGGTYPMTDLGSGIWEASIELAEGTYEYKFAADSWSIDESLVEGTSCTITTDGFTNRVITVGTEDITLDVVCWASCEACDVSVNEIEGVEINVYPNPNNTGELTIDYAGSDKVIIYNALGAQVSIINLENGIVTEDISALNAGVYFLKDSEGRNLTELVIVK